MAGSTTRHRAGNNKTRRKSRQRLFRREKPSACIPYRVGRGGMGECTDRLLASDSASLSSELSSTTCRRLRLPPPPLPLPLLPPPPPPSSLGNTSLQCPGWRWPRTCPWCACGAMRHTAPSLPPHGSRGSHRSHPSVRAPADAVPREQLAALLHLSRRLERRMHGALHTRRVVCTGRCAHMRVLLHLFTSRRPVRRPLDPSRGLPSLARCGTSRR